MIDFMIAAVIAALVNVVLLAITVTTYVQNMRLIRSYYTLGLVLVATLLMIQNVVIVIFCARLYMHNSELMKSADMISHYLFAINIVQTIGLSILLWITRR